MNTACPVFGRDLVWCVAALVLYGVLGQIFVRQTPLVPSNILNSANFLQWFGIPIQLFRGMMAAILTLFMLRALRAFELEGQRRLEAANVAKLEAQAATLEAERRVSREMKRLNEETAFDNTRDVASAQFIKSARYANEPIRPLAQRLGRDRTPPKFPGHWHDSVDPTPDRGAGNAGGDRAHR